MSTSAPSIFSSFSFGSSFGGGRVVSLGRRGAGARFDPAVQLVEQVLDVGVEAVTLFAVVVGRALNFHGDDPVAIEPDDDHDAPPGSPAPSPPESSRATSSTARPSIAPILYCRMK